MDLLTEIAALITRRVGPCLFLREQRSAPFSVIGTAPEVQLRHERGETRPLPKLWSRQRKRDELMWTMKPILPFAAIGAVLISASSAFAGPVPLGLWIDHTGRGGVEITQCGTRLCGHIAWLKDAKNSEACGVQVIGDAKQMRNGTWDRGWIYDPEADSKYDVELKPIGSKKLRVMGYAGTKFLSETMIWKRAPIGLTKCTKPGSEKTATATVSEKEVKTSQNSNNEARPAISKTKANTTGIATNETTAVDPENTEATTEPETKGKRKGALAKIVKAVADMSDEKGKSPSGSKRMCRVSVPHLNMVVKVPCDG